MRRVTLQTAGESHGPGLTAILHGIPAGLTIDAKFVQSELRRRMHGYGRGGRMKIEADEAQIRGGIRAGVTMGSPIAFWIENRDYRNWVGVMSSDPAEIDSGLSEQRRLKSPRPGHADLAGGIKYLRHDLRDVLERASARESAARVAAGAVAKVLLRQVGIEIRSGVRSLGPLGVGAPPPTWAEIQRVDDSSPLRAIDHGLEGEMVALVDATRREGDTLGGSVSVVAHNVPPGLGSYVHWHEKLDGRLAQAVMSVPAVKAVEIGAALTASNGPGSAAHDLIEFSPAPTDRATGGWHRPTNRAGGLEGGVTNGCDVVITAYKKPISTLRRGMPSVDLDTLESAQSQYERSDVTALPAAGVIAEAMVALVLADALLEKLGGDSMDEVLAHWQETQRLQAAWPRSSEDV
jgi:chorismate synthase